MVALYQRAEIAGHASAHLSKKRQLNHNEVAWSDALADLETSAIAS